MSRPPASAPRRSGPAPLTRDQRRALDLTSHLAVTANAGAGKTTVLARRYVEIFLRTDARIQEVAAITFTEQAAGELRTKIRGLLAAAATAEGLTAETRARLEGIRARLASAPIGTIHSFCSGILRLHPAEADVDAAFTVVEGPERQKMVGESIAATLAAAMEGGDGGVSREAFRDLLRAVPPVRLEGLLAGLFRQRERLHRSVAAPDPAAEAGDRGDAGARVLAEVCARALAADWWGSAREAALAAGGEDAARVLELLGPPGPPPEPSRLAGVIVGSRTLIFTGKGAFRKSFLGKTPPGALPAAAAARLVDFEASFAPILEAAAAGRDDGRYRRITADLMRLFLAAQARYESRKEEAGALDFEDLQIRTLNLLSSAETRSRIAAGWRFLLVDEFQDTNDLQYAIVRALVDGYREGNLFIVGDPKQSIYRFRNADVGVFADARADIARAEVARAGAGGGDDGARGSLVLAESFRPLPAVAAVVNVLFSSLLRDTGARHEVGYDPIVVGRASDSPGAVELMLTPAPEGARGRAAVRAECDLVARRLLELNDPGEEGRSVPFGECAVLLRDRTHLPPLELAFEEAGIPYLLAGGVGFFQTQEVGDFLNYLRFLILPDDDAALAGILRSPFFGISDAELLRISLVKAATLGEKLLRAAGAENAPPEVRRAARILDAHRAIADRIPLPRLLRRIAADTGWLGTAAGLSHGSQHHENFLKLLGLARRRGAPGTGTIADFAAALERRAGEEAREGQAATADVGRAVRIMTVHAAKGLEFTAVVLPFLHRPVRYDREPLIHPGLGIGINVAEAAGGEGEGGGSAGVDGSPEGDDGRSPRSLLPAYLKQLSREQAIAEEKRIFYVACTRARDRLILSAADLPPSRRSPSPLGWLRAMLEERGVAEADSRLDFGTVPVTVLDRTGGGGGHRKVDFPLSVRVIRPVPGAPPLRAASPEPPGGGDPRILTAPLIDASGGDTYTATALKTFLECPLLYRHRVVLGSGEPGPLLSGDPDGGRWRDDGNGLEAGGTAALEGEIVHDLLSVARAGMTAEEVAARIGERLAATPPATGAEVMAERIGRQVMAFLASREGAEILSRPDARTEYELSTLLGDAVVIGKVDRLFRGEEGQIEFVDYKSDEMAPGDASAPAVRVAAHRPQMEIYALLISRLTGQTAARGRLVFLKGGPAVVSLAFGPAELAATERRLLGAIDAIRAGRFSPASKPCALCASGGRERCGLAPAAQAR